MHAYGEDRVRKLIKELHDVVFVASTTTIDRLPSWRDPDSLKIPLCILTTKFNNYNC